MSRPYILKKGVSYLSDLRDDSAFGRSVYLDTLNGSDGNDGYTWEQAVKTMSKALTLAETNSRVFFVGDVREELTGSNLKFGVNIIGMGGVHHADSPATGYNTGASVWRPPASPTATTPLLKVRGRGWKFINVLFDCPVDAAAVYLERNALSGTSEYDASHAQFINCRFESGKVGIENAGGCGFVIVEGCRFYRLSESGGAGIKCTSTAVAVPLNWQIKDCHFANNASHILSSVSYSLIQNNIFGRFTATLSIDIDDQPSSNQGEYNVITGNYLTGSFAATAYPPGSNNEWAGNQNVAGITTADPS
jgi:hypothetical protein